MHPHEVARLLAERGYQLVRTTGKHQRWVHLDGHHITVSAHSHAMSPRLLRVIERQGRRLAVTQDAG